MSDFNWCHGPQCHEKHTVDRVRGVKGSKVLRTRKIKLNQYIEGTQWGFFCRVMDWSFLTLGPRRNGYDLSCVSFPKIILAMITAEETPLCALNILV